MLFAALALAEEGGEDEPECDLAEAGWEINVVLARTPAGWRLLEAGCVYP